MIIEAYVSGVRLPTRRSYGVLGPSTSTEVNFLEVLADAVPRLAKEGISDTLVRTFATHALAIANDSRHEVRGSSDYLRRTRQLTSQYSGLLENDVIELHNIGFPEEGISAFIERATHTCFTTVIENRHLSEERRLENYTRVTRLVKERRKARALTKDPYGYINRVFQSVVYGDGANVPPPSPTGITVIDWAIHKVKSVVMR